MALSLPKQKIRLLLLEGVNDSAVRLFQANLDGGPLRGVPGKHVRGRALLIADDRRGRHHKRVGMFGDRDVRLGEHAHFQRVARIRCADARERRVRCRVHAAESPRCK